VIVAVRGEDGDAHRCGIQRKRGQADCEDEALETGSTSKGDGQLRKDEDDMVQNRLERQKGADQGKDAGEAEI
jgi:hypothetical protein